MKKIILCLIAVTFVAAFLISKDEKIVAKDIETKGVFISYLEYEKYFKGLNSKEIDIKIKEMLNNLDKYHINTIYLQVRMFSDSIYKSNIFPFTDTIASYQGENIGIDVLDIFIKYAKEKNIKIYAWINPYRISTNKDITKLAKNNPAYIYLNTNHVYMGDNGIYYNPASKVVKNLIVSGVVEIIKNYDVAGIIFDDYFYPSAEIDLDNYKEYENTISIKDYRLSQVNELISTVYRTIKSINKNIEFGISPDGNIENNYDINYADVKKWLSEDGYIDFIIPQIYYGFNNEVKPFIKTVNAWNDLIKNNTKLIVGLALYKSGDVDSYAKSGEYEWINNTDIIKKEIEYARNLTNYLGFSLFRYEDLIEPNNIYKQEEVKNFLKFIEN